MTTESLVAIVLATLTYFLSGARKPAYLLYCLAFLPFVSVDPASGGLQNLAGFGGQNVLFKMSVRLATSAGLLLLLFRRHGALRHILLPLCWPILFYVLWALVGLLQRPSPWLQTVRLGELLIFFLTGVCLFLEAGREHGPRKVARWHCLALLPMCLVTLYAARTQPEIAFHDGLGGIRLGHHFVESNVLGFAACVLMLWATHELRERRERERSWTFERLLPLVVLVVSTGIMVYARSRTAMITVVAGQFLMWFPFYQGDSKRRVVFVFLVLFVLALVASQSDTIMAWFLRGDSVTDLLSGTGRTDLWAALLTEQVPKAPLFGSGYLTLSEAGPFLHHGTWFTNAHNTYIFALVSTGIPGLVAVLAITFLPLHKTFRRVFTSSVEHRSSWVLLFALQVVVTITSITGFGITGFPNAVMLFNFAIYLYCVAAPQRGPAHGRRRTQPTPPPEERED